MVDPLTTICRSREPFHLGAWGPFLKRPKLFEPEKPFQKPRNLLCKDLFMSTDFASKESLHLGNVSNLRIFLFFQLRTFKVGFSGPKTFRDFRETGLWSPHPMMASTHRVLITGASGLLGRSIFKTFSGSDQWEVLGLAHSRASGALRKVNLLDFDEAKRVVEEFRPDVLIHSAAERRPDVAENDQETSTKMNVGVSEILASAVNELNKDLPKAEHYMLYISSCYVFDGKSPPYKPTDKPNPLNKYGKTKLQGEQVVISCLPAAGVLRVPILYGCVEYLQESSVTGKNINS